jgi:hypothetical protein
MVIGKKYKHDKCVDVAFMPISVKANNASTKLVGFWINVVNPKAPYIMAHEVIKIRNEDLKDWKEYECGNIMPNGR